MTAIADHIRAGTEALGLTSHATDDVRAGYASRDCFTYGGKLYRPVPREEYRALGYPEDTEEVLIRAVSSRKVFTVWLAACVQPAVNLPPLPGAGGAA